MNPDQQVELYLTYVALVRIRQLARELVDSGGNSTALASIIALCDGFHAVPYEISRGRTLDPELFKEIATSLDMATPPEYPHIPVTQGVHHDVPQ